MNMRRAFSLVEVTVVVLILAILAALVVPRFASATDDARSAALESSVEGVRASIAAFRTERVLSGADPFPTLAELTAAGTVLQAGIPENPYSGLASVQAVSESQADARTVASSGSFGWNYFVDNSSNPPRAVFYANSSEPTKVSDGAGGTRNANEV
ncbi:MAG: type II secretion system protein [Planctomycetota bacterium]